MDFLSTIVSSDRIYTRWIGNGNDFSLWGAEVKLYTIYIKCLRTFDEYKQHTREIDLYGI